VEYKAAEFIVLVCVCLHACECLPVLVCVCLYDCDVVLQLLWALKRQLCPESFQEDCFKEGSKGHCCTHKRRGDEAWERRNKGQTRRGLSEGAVGLWMILQLCEL